MIQIVDQCGCTGSLSSLLQTNNTCKKERMRGRGQIL